ncbi:hypothetical protein A2U01_0045138, partial [Trifolium medium]|nr:hypothetical protein [Trifolium medium]
ICLAFTWLELALTLKVTDLARFELAWSHLVRMEKIQTLICYRDASFPTHHNVTGINFYLRNEDGARIISAKSRLLITMASCS